MLLPYFMYETKVLKVLKLIIHIFIKIFNKANTSNTTNIPAIYLNVSFVKKLGNHTNAISIIIQKVYMR